MTSDGFERLQGNGWGWSVENQSRIFSRAIPIEEMERGCWKRRRERFPGAMQGRTNKGLIVTAGTFTVDAYKEATRDGAPSIDLVDGGRLCVLLRDPETRDADALR